jgi:MFS transporter, SHS family, lactate transporter
MMHCLPNYPGNLVSSASSTIESTIGERFPLPPKGKTRRYEYGRVICIFMACVYVYVIVLAFLGPENLGRSFGVEHDDDLAEATGKSAIAATTGKQIEKDQVQSLSETEKTHEVSVV